MGSDNARKARAVRAPAAPGAKTIAGGSRTLAADDKSPRTARGERTYRNILKAALEEFGERGFSDASIVGITRRANVALGTFYTYFQSKDEAFQALVQDMSDQVRDRVAPALKGAKDGLDAERLALAAFLRFASENKQVYRIIDEAEFVDPAGFRAHYEKTAARIAGRLRAARDAGEIRELDAALGDEVAAWAIMGANVFLGLRFAVWGSEDPDTVAAITSSLLRSGLEPR